MDIPLNDSPDYILMVLAATIYILGFFILCPRKYFSKRNSKSFEERREARICLFMFLFGVELAIAVFLRYWGNHISPNAYEMMDKWGISMAMIVCQACLIIPVKSRPDDILEKN